jgi:phage protein D
MSAQPARQERYETLAPAFKVRVNGAALPQEAVADVMSIVVLDDVDAASMGTLRIKAWSGVQMKPKWIDDALFTEGNPIEIELGYRDSTQLLFSGEIVGLEPDFPEGAPPTLTVRAYDRRHRLMRERHTRSFLDSTDSDIASRIADDAGMGVRSDDSEVVHPYVLQHNQTDWQFLAARAASIGWELRMEDGDLALRARPVGAKPALTLHRDEDLLSFRPRLSTMGQTGARELRAWSAKDKQAVVANASVGDEGPLLQGSTSGGAAARHAFHHVGSSVVNRPVQSQPEADQLARQAFRELALHYVRADGLCIGEPELRAGIVVSLVGLGERFGGSYYVSSAEHRFDVASGYRTRFEARRNAT